MSNVIVGAFDNPHDVEPVISELLAEGIPRSKIEVMDQNNRMKEDGMFGGFKHWLQNLGLQNEDPDYFAESVRRGSSLVTVTLDEDDDAMADQNRITEIFNRHGVIDIDRRAEHYRSSGFSSFDESAQPYNREEIIAERERFSPGGTFAIPVVEEDVRIGKHQINNGGVRIVKRVTEQPVEEEVQLKDERFEIERRNVDRPVNASDMDAFKEDVMEFQETSEEVDVKKEARVKEEILVRKEVDEHTETVRETARRTDVDVERTGRNQDLRRP